MPEEAMRAALEALKALQDCDDEIAECRRRQQAIPTEVASLHAGFAEHRAAMDQREALLHQKQVERKNMEIDLEEDREKIKKLKLQLYQVKTNREYSALLSEIKALEETCSRLEDGILALMEEIDRFSREAKTDKIAAASERERLEGENTRLQQDLDSIARELVRLQETRARISSRIDGVVLAQYERISRVRQGKAVVPAKQGVSFGKDHCGGCFSNLPPQLLMEIRKSEQLITCYNCGRILVWMNSSTSPSDARTGPS
jgi:predicted  nucleic acid-binding Zn-ribbon protein